MQQTNATTDHHQTLSKHPAVPNAGDALKCPALKEEIKSVDNQKLDEGICPVVGPVSTILPPDHPTIEAGEGKREVCPVTKAKVGHHKGAVNVHPSVEGAAEGAVCPVVGKKVGA